MNECFVLPPTNPKNAHQGGLVHVLKKARQGGSVVSSCSIRERKVYISGAKIASCILKQVIKHGKISQRIINLIEATPRNNG